MISVLDIFLENEMVNPHIDYPFSHLLGFLYQKQSGFAIGFLLWEERERVNFHKVNIGSYGKINGGPRTRLILAHSYSTQIRKAEHSTH